MGGQVGLKITKKGSQRNKNKTFDWSSPKLGHRENNKIEELLKLMSLDMTCRIHENILVISRVDFFSSVYLNVGSSPNLCVVSLT